MYSTWELLNKQDMSIDQVFSMGKVFHKVIDIHAHEKLTTVVYLILLRSGGQGTITVLTVQDRHTYTHVNVGG